MPELPEVETIRLFLSKKLPGKTISKIEILSSKSFSGDPKKIIGQKIIRLTRVGKQLSIHLSNNLILLVHLKMTGQLIYNCHLKPACRQAGKRGISASNHTHLFFTFSDRSKLFFNDLRKFGWIHLLTPKEVASHQSLLGIDILSPKFTLNYFKKILAGSKKPIKTLLHDQNQFAGIGNIYANDALFLAKIHPLTPAKNLVVGTRRGAFLLYRNILKVIKEGIVHGGSTARDRGYIRPDGSAGEHQSFFRVYQKQGEPCPRCHSKITRLKLSGRSAFICPKCQILVK